jgi:hypothetical protein
MLTIRGVLFGGALVCGALSAQDGGFAARDLYFRQEPAAGETAPPRLGLRYNILLIDPATQSAREVDSDAPLRAGDCIALRLRPNRDGHVYLFNEATSGAWQPMLPSPLMPGESNSVRGGSDVQVPSGHCFTLNNPPGTENLLVVVTEMPEDFYRLNESIRNSVHRDGSQAVSTSPQSDLSAVLRQLGAASGRASTGLASRDLGVQKIGVPISANEPRNSVYVVRTAAAPADRIVITIPIRHR